jgi:hypothetical protein
LSIWSLLAVVVVVAREAEAAVPVDFALALV